MVLAEAHDSCKLLGNQFLYYIFVVKRMACLFSPFNDRKHFLWEKKNIAAWKNI